MPRSRREGSLSATVELTCSPFSSRKEILEKGEFVATTDSTRRRVFILTGMVFGVVALAMGIWWWLTVRNQATPDIVEGWAMPNATGDAISLHDSDDTRDGNSYIIAGAWWSGPDDVLHLGSIRPTCIGTDTTVKKHVQLGVVDVEDSEFGEWAHVVWVKCLD
jgi:hypothetical protein